MICQECPDCGWILAYTSHQINWDECAGRDLQTKPLSLTHGVPPADPGKVSEVCSATVLYNKGLLGW